MAVSNFLGYRWVSIGLEKQVAKVSSSWKGNAIGLLREGRRKCTAYLSMLSDGDVSIGIAQLVANIIDAMHSVPRCIMTSGRLPRDCWIELVSFTD